MAHSKTETISSFSGYHFDAFISYRRSDGAKAARHLRKRLQSFDISKRLKHRKSKHLRVFLDTAYERGAHDFYERNIYPELLRARHLIVIATPDAVLRPDEDDWIQREISDFRNTRGEENILVVRASGDFLAELPGDLDRTAPNIQIVDLRKDQGISGLSPMRASRIADEWLKLVAPLFEVGTDEMPILRREQERAQQARLSLLLGAFIGAFLFAVTLSTYALRAQAEAARTLRDSQFTVASLISQTGSMTVSDDNEQDINMMLMTGCDLFDSLSSDKDWVNYPNARFACDLERISGLYNAGETQIAMQKANKTVAIAEEAYALNATDWTRADALSKALKLEHLLYTLEYPDGLLHDITLPFLHRLTEIIDANPENFTPVALYIEAATEAYTYAEAKGDMNASWAIMSDGADLLKRVRAVIIEGNKPPPQQEESPDAEQVALENAMYSELALPETTMRRRLSWLGIQYNLSVADKQEAIAQGRTALNLSIRAADRFEEDTEEWFSFFWERALSSSTTADGLLEIQGDLPKIVALYRQSDSALRKILSFELSDDFQAEVINHKRYVEMQLVALGG